MSDLAVLRSHLRALRHRRRLACWAAAYSVLALAVLGMLSLLALMDAAFALSRWPRVVAEVLGVLIVAAVFFR
ncbi:MAG TPA: hypothetical protein VIK18_05745, partial [Pirellulales bacterium]